MALKPEQESFIIETIDYYSIDDAISCIGMGWFQYRLLILTGLIWMADSMEIMLLSFLSPILKKEWNLESPQDGLIGAVVFIGMLIGSLMFAILSDKYGRKTIIIIGCIMCSIFGFLSGLAPNIFIMLILRFIVGTAVGSVPVAYTLFAEYCPSEYRGRILILQTGLWSFGALFSVFLAWICLSIYQNWRCYLILSSLPFIIATILSFGWMPKSVRYLLIRGQMEEAKQILIDIAETNKSELPQYGELRPISNINMKRGRICDLFINKYRFNSIIALITFSLLVFNYYGISFISTRYFKSIESISSNQYWMMAISTASELPSILFGFILLDRIGRKRTLNLTIAVFVLCLFILLGFENIEQNEICAVIIVSIGRMNINLAFNTIYIYFTEYYPTTIRSTAIGIASSLGRISGIITSFISQDMSIKNAFIVYMLTSIALFVATILLSNDSIGKELPSTIESERHSESNQHQDLIELTDHDNDITSPFTPKFKQGQGL